MIARAFQHLTFSLEKIMSSWVLEGEVSAHLSPHEFYNMKFSTLPENYSKD